MTRSTQGSREGKPLRVAMLTKRPPYDRGGVERAALSGHWIESAAAMASSRGMAP